MRQPKVTKLVHIPTHTQACLDEIKRETGITHTAVIVRGIQLAYIEIKTEQPDNLKSVYPNLIEGGNAGMFV